MKFNREFLSYGYEMDVHPDVRVNQKDPKVNCAWLVLKVIKDNLNINLLENYFGRYSIIELINDEHNFKTLKFSTDDLKNHDIILFQTRYSASKNMHIGIYLGELQNGEPMILHSSYTTNGVIYEKLSQTCNYRTPKYNNQRFLPIYIKRLIQS